MSQAPAALVDQARRVVDLPHLAAAYPAGSVHTGNLRAILEHRKACGPDVPQAHEPALVDLATRAGPPEIHAFCHRPAEVNHPDRDQRKAKALGAGAGAARPYQHGRWGWSGHNPGPPPGHDHRTRPADSPPLTTTGPRQPGCGGEDSRGGRAAASSSWLRA